MNLRRPLLSGIDAHALRHPATLYVGASRARPVLAALALDGVPLGAGEGWQAMLRDGPGSAGGQCASSLRARHLADSRNMS